MVQEAGFFILYLIYGLVFFTLGAAILARNLRYSSLRIARILWLFAVFALLHGCNEWMILFVRLNRNVVDWQLHTHLFVGNFLLLNLSFMALFWFGLELVLERPTRMTWVLLGGLAIFLVAHPLAGLFRSPPDAGLFEMRTRMLLGLPASLLAGAGLWRHARGLVSLSASGARNLKRAGAMLIGYGVVAGAFSSGSYLGGFPVELWRALAAGAIFYFMMRGMKIFETEHFKRVEERLRRFAQSEKLVSLGKLSAGIAHEINNPLTNALMNVGLLEKRLGDLDDSDPFLWKRLDGIKRNITRAAKIAGELLYFSREGEGAFEPLALDQVLNQTLDLVGNRKQHYDIQLRVDRVPDVVGVPWKIEEVFLNVLMNAMDASQPGGLIDVWLGVEGPWVCCRIRDEGTGIEPEILDRLFDPFFTTKEPGKGTGLGLSICYGIMQFHGGEIHIDSEPGRGTTVRLLFPIPDEATHEC